MHVLAGNENDVFLVCQPVIGKVHRLTHCSLGTGACEHVDVETNDVASTLFAVAVWGRRLCVGLTDGTILTWDPKKGVQKLSTPKAPQHGPETPIKGRPTLAWQGHVSVGVSTSTCACKSPAVRSHRQVALERIGPDRMGQVVA